jgi:hypothetical protein
MRLIRFPAPKRWLDAESSQHPCNTIEPDGELGFHRMSQRPALIWYGVQGEGRGHATRSKVVIEALRAEGCAVRVFTGGDAMDLFPGERDLEEIPLLRFHFGAGGRLDFMATAARNLKPLRGILRRSSPAHENLRRLASRTPPDLVISDFEPLLGRFATRSNIPWISVDHQHILTDTVLPNLGRGPELLLLARLSEWLVPAPVRVVSSFHHFPLRPGSRARLVGCFLRQGFARRPVRDEGHVCAYLKEPGMLAPVLGAMAGMPETAFHLWCAGTAITPENVRLSKPCSETFLDDLATCSWLLTTAGNQLLGEALALGKPVLAIPVPGQTEQALNAAALEASGCGRSTALHLLEPNLIRSFQSGLDGFGAACRRRNRDDAMVDGTSAVLETVLPGFQRRTKAA